MAWLLANFQTIIVALLAIDTAIMPIFPNVTLFEKIAAFLKSA